MDLGYADEIDWQSSATLSDCSESDFLREASWVILSAGMREQVVRKCFPAISAAFFDWTSSRRIAAKCPECVANARKSFAHPQKMNAIANMAIRVHQDGFAEVSKCIRLKGPDYLETFEFIGPVTSYHLAKNLGLDVVKPDRHLIRLAAATCRESPAQMCEEISSVTGDRVSVVDLVLWRFANRFPDYAEAFAARTSKRAA